MGNPVSFMEKVVFDWEKEIDVFCSKGLKVTKLRIGWRPLKFWIKNKRFPNRKPFLYSPKYFYHSIKLIKTIN